MFWYSVTILASCAFIFIAPVSVHPRQLPADSSAAAQSRADEKAFLLILAPEEKSDFQRQQQPRAGLAHRRQRIRRQRIRHLCCLQRLERQRELHAALARQRQELVPRNRQLHLGRRFRPGPHARRRRLHRRREHRVRRLRPRRAAADRKVTFVPTGSGTVTDNSFLAPR